MEITVEGCLGIDGYVAVVARSSALTLTLHLGLNLLPRSRQDSGAGIKPASFIGWPEERFFDWKISDLEARTCGYGPNVAVSA